MAVTDKQLRKERGIREITPNVFEVSAYIAHDPATGKPRHVFRRLHTSSIKAARDYRKDLREELKAGDAIGKAGEEPTFGDLLEKWLKHGEKRGRSPSTTDGYRRKIEAQIQPRLGDLYLSKITTNTIDEFYNDLIDAGLSPANIRNHHRIISAALGQAVKWKDIPDNPARHAEIPQTPRSVNTPPTDTELQEIIARAEKTSVPELAPMIFVAAATGLRRGELCGLKWEDLIDTPQGPALVVRRSIWQTRKDHGEKQTKTNQVRVMSIGARCREVLEARRQRADDLALATTDPGVVIGDESYIFTNDISGRAPFLPGTLTMQFGRLMATLREETDRPWRFNFHGLRHYYATTSIADGHSLTSTAAALGHVDTTLVAKTYGHATSGELKEMSTSIEAHVRPPGATAARAPRQRSRKTRRPDL